MEGYCQSEESFLERKLPQRAGTSRSRLVQLRKLAISPSVCSERCPLWGAVPSRRAPWRSRGSSRLSRISHPPSPWKATKDEGNPNETRNRGERTREDPVPSET